MIFVFIACVLVLYSLINFKKSFMLYMAFELVWFPNAKLISITGLPSIPLYFFTSSAFVLIFLLKRRNIKKSEAFPFTAPLLMVSLSYFFTCFTSYIGFFDDFSRTIGFLTHNFLEVWVIWVEFRDENDFRQYFKYAIFVFFFATLYGVVEYCMQTNILLEYKSTLTPEGLSIYPIDPFRGYRMSSIFEHPIGAGMNFALFSVLIGTMSIKLKEGIPLKTLAYVTAILSIGCILLTKMRSGIFFALVALLALFDLKNKKFIKILIFGFISFLVVLPFFSNESLNVLLSLFNTAAQEKVGGSSFEMRLVQLDAVLNLVNRSPIFGLGERFSDAMNNSFVIDALGFESIWFEQLSKHGFFGALVNIFLAFFSIAYIPRKYHSKGACYLALAYWLTYSLTSIPSFRMSFYYIVYFYFIKQCNNKKKGDVLIN